MAGWPDPLKAAHEKRNTLIRELGTAVMHPADLLGSAAKNIAQDYTSKWKRFNQAMRQTSLSATFEAGRISGEILVDVLMLIGTASEIAKATKFLAEIPELVRLSKSIGSATGRGLAEEGNAAGRFGEFPEANRIGESRRPDWGTPRLRAGDVNVGVSGGRRIGSMVVLRVLKKGESLADLIEEAKTIGYETQSEVAVVKLANGERALVSGGAEGITFSDGSIIRLYGHTHPFPTGPSSYDFDAIESLGQRSSWIYEAGGLTKFKVK